MFQKLYTTSFGKKRDRIKRNTLIGKIEYGGIGIIDVESKFNATKATWISRIINAESITHRTLKDILQPYNISVFDLIKTNEHNFNETEFFRMLDLPQFYGNVFSAFNKCKMPIHIDNLNRDNFLSMFLWNNRLLQYKSKPLCFKNWIKSGILYTKDIFDESGEMHDILYFSNRIIKKNNILCEYYMLKNSVRAYIRKFDCSYAKYVTIKQDVKFLFRNNVVKLVNDAKCNFYYSILVDMKFQKPLNENRWKRLFDITGNSTWKQIYTSRKLRMTELRIAEFNYKLLHGILNNNVSVSKWNKGVSPLCEICKTEEDTSSV